LGQPGCRDGQQDSAQRTLCDLHLNRGVVTWLIYQSGSGQLF
jgi:hypothetical protein